MAEERREKYGKYKKALEKIIPELKKDIAKSPDGLIKIKTKDLAKKMGAEEFEKLHVTSLYWGVKYVLFHEDIIVASQRIDGEPYLVMRAKRDDIDLLPVSLAKEKKEKEKKGKKL